MNQKELAWQAQIEALITEREAMVAENKQREALGQAIAYHDHNFFVVAEELNKLVAIIKNG